MFAEDALQLHPLDDSVEQSRGSADVIGAEFEAIGLGVFAWDDFSFGRGVVRATSDRVRDSVRSLRITPRRASENQRKCARGTKRGNGSSRRKKFFRDTFIGVMTFPKKIGTVSSRRNTLKNMDLHPFSPLTSRVATLYLTISRRRSCAVMIHSVDPRQNRLFDPFDGVIPRPDGRSSPTDGRASFATSSSRSCPSANSRTLQRLPRRAHQGTLFHGRPRLPRRLLRTGPPQEAVEAYIFRSDVQYALNLEPGVAVCRRTLERYQKLFRDDDLAARSSITSPPNSSGHSISTSPDSGSTRPTSSATWPASAGPSSWPWRSSGS